MCFSKNEKNEQFGSTIIKKIMNDENNCDDNVEADALEDLVCSESRDVVYMLKMNIVKAPRPSNMFLELIAGSRNSSDV